MEAHAGTVRIPTPTKTEPRRRRLLRLLRELSAARRERAIQTHGARAPYVPGSEHTHLILPPKAY
jgi:hypothetical protein